MTDFFNDETQTENAEETQTFKLGEKEYNQDELSRLVGLGELAAEAEEKYNTKIDRVFPEFTKATQERAELRKRVEEMEAKATAPIPPVNGQYTPEQMKQEALRQAEELGIGPNAFRNIVREEMAARELLTDIDSLLGEAKEKGQPVTSNQELLQHMAETGIRNPVKAYKDMFETELDAIKEKQLSAMRSPGMITTTQSTAGAKQPSSVPITRANLSQLVGEALNAGGN